MATINPSRVLPSAKLVVDDGSLVIINVIGDSIVNRILYGVVNKIWSLAKGYKGYSAGCENSIYIPFPSISSVGKKRCSKMRAFIISLAMPAAMFIFGWMDVIGIGFVVLLLVLAVILALTYYVVTGNVYALTIEINSGFEYLLTTNDPNFVEEVYKAVKSIIDNPEQPIVSNITYDFRNATVINSTVTAKTLGS
ncbi:MAG: DUF6232 family protein [Defluviitaleaceae bacterium]|nr:DUF6232 family protein [Defluviitaleaceae bacterium]